VFRIISSFSSLLLVDYRHCFGNLEILWVIADFHAPMKEKEMMEAIVGSFMSFTH
jgi:hypothetical protein